MTLDSIVASTIVLVVLLWTQYPSVPGGDSGELIAESCLLGTAHPPGYPLFTILSNVAIHFGKVMSIVFSLLVNNDGGLSEGYSQSSTTVTSTRTSSSIDTDTSIDISTPFQMLFSPARCVNTLCCIFGAAACYALSESITLYLSSFQKDSKRGREHEHERGHEVMTSVCGAIGGVLFALSPLTWEYSIMAEVFALNNFLIASIIYQTVQIGNLITFTQNHEHDHEHDFVRLRVMSYAMRGAFIAGLAISNQHTSILFIVPIVLYVIHILHGLTPSERKAGRTGKTAIVFLSLSIGKLALCFIVGLSPYVYLNFASQIPKAGAWGDQTTLTGFLRHVLRSEYGSLSLAAGKFDNVEGSMIRWAAYIMNTFHQFSAFGIFLSVIGILHSLKVFKNSRQKPRRSGSGTGFLLLMTLMHYLLWWNGVFSNLPLSNSMAYEVQSRFFMQPNVLVCFFAGVGSFVFISSLWSSYKGLYVSILCRMTLVMVLGGCISRQYYANLSKGPSQGMIINDYANAVLTSLPQNSLLLSHSDLNWNSVRYLQACEEKRTDVTHLSLQLLPYPWFERQKSKHYSHIAFPPILSNVDTNVNTHGYSEFLTRFLKANINNKDVKGGIFIEMQAILSSDLQSGGGYKDEFTIIPWGLVYRVVPKLDDENFTTLRNNWQPKSLFQMTKVRQQMKNHVSSNVLKGSWEFAALSVFWDMHYQLGLHILGVALSMSTAIKEDKDLFPVYLLSLRASSKILSQVADANDKQKGILNQSENDVIKNTALSQMRFNEAAKVSNKIKSTMPTTMAFSSNEMEEIATSTKKAISKYLSNFYLDEDMKDYRIFDSYYDQMYK